MADMTQKQKKELAGLLYMNEGLTQQEVAEKVGASRQTVSKWVKAEKWDERKVGLTLTREYQVESLYRQVAALNDVISKRPKEERFATPTEADTLAKLSNSIKKMEVEVGIADIISVARRFVKYVRAIDLDQAKKITGLFDSFIKESI